MGTLKHGAEAGEVCALCKLDVNEGAFRCSGCGAVRRLQISNASKSSGLALIVFGGLALLVTLPIIAVFEVHWVITALAVAGVALAVIGSLILATAKKRVYWMTR